MSSSIFLQASPTRSTEWNEKIVLFYPSPSQTRHLQHLTPLDRFLTLDTTNPRAILGKTSTYAQLCFVPNMYQRQRLLIAQ